MSENKVPEPVLAHPVDHSIKLLVTQTPNVFLRLVGSTIRPEWFRRDNTAINIPGLAADYVHVIEVPGEEPWVFYQEFVLRPKPGDPWEWELKKAGLRRIHQKRVLLLVVYLEKGEYATFPDSLVENAGGLTNGFTFSILRLWEFRELIASGADPYLLPLRLLVEENPTPQTLEEIRAGIKSSALPIEEQRELLSVTVILGSRLFTREVVMSVIGEEGVPVREWPVIGELIVEAEDKARDEGTATEARRMALVALRGRFGNLPESVVERVNGANREWCEDIVGRAYQASSLEDLGLI